jgi:hypothetical protein
VIYEHGELLLNYIDKGKLLTHPAELSGNPLGTDIRLQAGGMGKRDENLAMQNISFHTCK